MFKKFIPTWHIHAIYNLTPFILYKHHIKAILADLDNTLIAWNNPYGTEQLREWLVSMEKAHIPVMVISNNSYKRVSIALSNLSLPYVASAFKPFPFGLKKALNELCVKIDDAVFIGDQILTDIFAGNSIGIRTILVDPIVQSDAWFTKINRNIEKIILKHLHNLKDIE